MEHDDLDRVLSGEENIVASSGFVAAVMDAVRSEAAAPPQIPFPCTRARAGWAASPRALVAFLSAALTRPGGQAASSGLAAFIESARAAGADWIVLALLLSLASVILSMRLTDSRT